MQLDRKSVIRALKKLSQSPYGAMWFATVLVRFARELFDMLMSQSPYGAMWFATGTFSPGPSRRWGSRNPLTGLCGLQLYPPKNLVLDGTA
ncbi:hypothetical protein, partial [Thermus sp.]|uniref:hypothetical protein n=1 Tax=Thermus sp. TaxID=275 RepID=UPI003D0DD060